MCRVIAEAVKEGKFVAANRPIDPRAASAGPTGARRTRRQTRAGQRRNPAARSNAAAAGRAPPSEAGSAGSTGRGAVDRAPFGRAGCRAIPRASPEAEAPVACRRGEPSPQVSEEPRPGDCADRQETGTAAVAAESPVRKTIRRQIDSRRLAITERGLKVPNFTAKDVQALRKATGAGMMDAKRALEATDGNADEAAKWLREKGLGGVAKRAGPRSRGGSSRARRSQTESGAIVEIRCETDFVAKSPSSSGSANELAVAGRRVRREGRRRARTEDLDNLRTTLKENISVGAGRADRDRRTDSMLGSYLHIQNERGVNARPRRAPKAAPTSSRTILHSTSRSPEPQVHHVAKRFPRPTSQRSGRRSSRSRGTRASPKLRSRRSSKAG